MTLCYYLTHPQVVVDPTVPVPQWPLNDVGRARVEAALGQSWMMNVERIVSSDEQKAIDTAAIIGGALGVDYEVGENFHENDRSATGFLPPEKFEAAATEFFTHPDVSFKGWEKAVDAQSRIVSSVKSALTTRNISTLFVGHGGVGTLLKCDLAGSEISRDHDQCNPPAAPGGGNILVFNAASWTLKDGWVAMEDADQL